MSSSHVYEVTPKDGEAADKRNTMAPNSVIQGMDDELTPPMSLNFDFGDIPDLQDLLEAGKFKKQLNRFLMNYITSLMKNKSKIGMKKNNHKYAAKSKKIL